MDGGGYCSLLTKNRWHTVCRKHFSGSSFLIKNEFPLCLFPLLPLSNVVGARSQNETANANKKGPWCGFVTIQNPFDAKLQPPLKPITGLNRSQILEDFLIGKYGGVIVVDLNGFFWKKIIEFKKKENEIEIIQNIMLIFESSFFDDFQANGG